MSVRRSGKPVVVSMGNMATSGGYLISGAFRKSDTKTIAALLLYHFLCFTALALDNRQPWLCDVEPPASSECSCNFYSVVSAMLQMKMCNE